jgi:hypothetical protein
MRGMCARRRRRVVATEARDMIYDKSPFVDTPKGTMEKGLCLPEAFNVPSGLDLRGFGTR